MKKLSGILLIAIALVFGASCNQTPEPSALKAQQGGPVTICDTTVQIQTVPSVDQTSPPVPTQPKPKPGGGGGMCQ
jgi:hypothetical protein